MKEKLKKFIQKLKFKIKEEINWRCRYHSLKHRYPFYRTLNIALKLLKIALLIGSFCLILIFSKVILFDKFLPYFNTDFSTKYITETGILGTQITLTLICVSLIALIANIDKKYLYGERLLDLAFPSKIFSFKLIMLTLITLLLSNIFLMFKGAKFVYIVFIFLITLYLAVILLYRFGSVFLSRSSFKNKLFCKYYKDNLIHMKKTRPIQPYTAKSLSSLKNVTLKHLTTKNYPELSENMVVYFDLLKSTLFNKPKVVQEYYTEYVNYEDIIGHINEFALSMLAEGNALYGVQIYNTLLRHINFYKVVCVQHIAFSSSYFIEALGDMSHKSQIKMYLTQLLNMSNSIIEQTYLYSVADFSYCRLAKCGDNIFYWAQSGMYEKIYDLINKSPNLSTEDKNELIEDIRFKLIDLLNSINIRSDVDSFKKKQRFPREKRVYSIDIKGEPLARYFIKLIENNDYQNLCSCKSFLGDYKDKNDYSGDFALILTILSVLNNISNNGKRIYEIDIKIDKKKCETLFKKSGIMTIKLNNDKLLEFYQFIVTHYVLDDNKNSSTPSGAIYNFHPKFFYKKEVVDAFFSYMIWRNQDEKSIQEIAIDNNLSYKEELESTILSLSEEKGIVYAIKHNKTRHNKNKGGCHCQCRQRVVARRRRC